LSPSDHHAFVLRPSPDVAVRGLAMCLHGFSGTPYEVHPLAHALAEAGFVVHAPLLPGHGNDPAALNRTVWRTWLAGAVETWDALRAHEGENGLTRIVVGGSMGGLLALHLSVVRAIDGLVLLAPALRFSALQTVLVAALGQGLWRVRPFLPKEGPGGDVGDVDAQRNNPTYKVLPTKGVAELAVLQKATRTLLPSVKTPACVLHGDLDQTIPPSASEEVVRRVGSSVVEHHRLARSRHLLAIDVERDRVNELALRFIDRIAGGTLRSPP
jgi:carboxylesterase